MCFSINTYADTIDISKIYDIPKQLSDCTFVRLTASWNASIVVVRCPNSVTTTTVLNKARTTTIVIDGVKYVPAK
jgi:hypothetical protein